MSDALRDPKEVRKATTDGIQRIYLIIVGLAITKSLQESFADKDGFLGADLFTAAKAPQLMLLAAFLFTAIRFAHGSVIHISAVARDGKWQGDMAFLILQAIMFFISALTINKLQMFVATFGFILSIDTLWLVFIILAKHGGSMEKQWFLSNVFIIVTFGFLYFAMKCDKISEMSSAIIILFVCIAAAFLDYWRNHDDYFPPLADQK